jgi:hypothetical protein
MTTPFRPLAPDTPLHFASFGEGRSRILLFHLPTAPPTDAWSKIPECLVLVTSPEAMRELGAFMTSHSSDDFQRLLSLSGSTNTALRHHFQLIKRRSPKRAGR